MTAFHRLSGSELEIMQAIWTSEEPATTAGLLEVFAHKGWKSQTMSTFLTRLVDKGLLVQGRRGKANTYVPALSPEEYQQREARSVLDSMYHGSVRDFLAALYGGKPLDAAEADALRRWFDEVTGHA